MNTSSLSAFLALAAMTGTTCAAVITRYDFNGFAPDTSASTAYSAFSTGSYVQAMNIQSPTSYIYTAGGFGNPWDGNLVRGNVRQNPVGAGIYIVDDAAAVQRNAYFAITINPSEAISLSSITLQAAADVYDPGGPAQEVFEVGMVLRSSATGWNVEDGLGSALIGAGMRIGEVQQITFDLSGIDELQNVTSPLTVRFYMNTAGANSGKSFYMDDIAFNGTSVPEPASAVLFGGGVALLGLRRRRKSA